VLDWAGFNSAVSYSFDDANSSQISHYEQMNALGVRFTFYLQTGKPEAADAIWQTAYEDGHELGNHTQNHTCGTSDVDAAQSFIQQHFGVTAYTMAAPNGDSACQSSASKFLIIRSVSGGDIGPKDSTNPAWIPSYIPGSMGTTAGKWKVYCIHGFTAAPMAPTSPSPSSRSPPRSSRHLQWFLGGQRDQHRGLLDRAEGVLGVRRLVDLGSSRQLPAQQVPARDGRWRHVVPEWPGHRLGRPRVLRDLARRRPPHLDAIVSGPKAAGAAADPTARLRGTLERRAARHGPRARPPCARVSWPRSIC
jgi:hypothetical protein